MLHYLFVKIRMLHPWKKYRSHIASLPPHNSHLSKKATFLCPQLRWPLWRGSTAVYVISLSRLGKWCHTTNSFLVNIYAPIPDHVSGVISFPDIYYTVCSGQYPLMMYKWSPTELTPLAIVSLIHEHRLPWPGFGCGGGSSDDACVSLTSTRPNDYRN